MCTLQAMGRALLLELERGRHAGEGFLLCRQLAASAEFAVLTEQNLLCIVKPLQSSAAVLRWAVALRDVLHFDRCCISIVTSQQGDLALQGASCFGIIQSSCFPCCNIFQVWEH